MFSSSSAVLYHGPGAREAALRAIHGVGRLLHSPFGEDGLKIAESREINTLISNAPLGDQIGVIVVGPLDKAPPASTDVLLKSLEEFNPAIVRPILWANDETEVSPTIRSRCLRRWCPGHKVIDEDMLETARKLVAESLGGHPASVIELLKDRDPRDVLVGASQVLNEQGIDENPKAKELWERIRTALMYSNPTLTETLAAFL